jgi:hypothetical protein
MAEASIYRSQMYPFKIDKEKFGTTTRKREGQEFTTKALLMAFKPSIHAWMQ